MPCRLACLLVASLLALPLTAQQGRKLSGPLARAPIGAFVETRTSPNGKTLVTFVDRDDDGQPELYSVPLEGGAAPVALRGNGPLLAAITRDSDRVLFLDDPDGNGSFDLVRRAIDGSTPAVVLFAVAPGGQVSWFEELGAEVVLVADPDGAGATRLFRVPLAGGAPVELSGPLVSGGGVTGFRATADGLQLVYLADAQVDERYELFVVPVNGGAPPRTLPIPLVADGDVYAFELGAGARVVYTADQDEDERIELFSIPLDGSAPPQRLNGPLVAGGDVGWEQFGYRLPYFQMSPDGRWAAYLADQEVDERFDLHGVPVDGSQDARRLSTDADGTLLPPVISPDSIWAVYLAESAGVYELRSAPLDGSAPSRRLNAPLVAGGSVSLSTDVSLEGRHVVYRADQEVDEQWELFAAPIDGGAPPRKLNAPLAPNGDVGFGAYGVLGDWQVVTENGVLYLVDPGDGILDLHFVELEAGVPRELLAGPVVTCSWSRSAPDVAVVPRAEELLGVALDGEAKPAVLDQLGTTVAGDVQAFQLSADGRHVAYTALGEGDLGRQLYSVRTDAPSEPVRLSVGMEGTFVSTFETSAPAGRALFEASLNGLYSVELEGGTPVELRPVFGNGHRGGSYTLAPDGLEVAYFLAGEVYVSPLDGSTPARPLSAGLPAGTALGRIRFSADGSHVGFLRKVAAQREILAVARADGNAPAALVADAPSVEDDFELDATGGRVFFRAVSPNGSHELYVAPSDGSATARLLNAPLPPRRAVSAFALTPDGARAVFLADAERAGTFELHSVPGDGSAAPLRLHPALSSSRDVRDFRVTSDGRAVVYRADALVDEQLELFAAPVEGGRPPLRLSGALVTGGDVLEFVLTPDGKRVLYRADQESDELVELYTTPIHGRGAVKLSRPLVAGGDVVSFLISADSRRVVFAAERDASGHRTLLVAPTDGRGKVAPIGGPLPPEGSIHGYALDRDGSLVLYEADQDLPGVVELYAVRPKVPTLR